MLNYNKCEKSQTNWDKTTYFCNNWRKGFCTDLATDNPQRRTKPYKYLNKVRALMNIVVSIIVEQMCPIMDCKDKDRDRSKHCWWDNWLKGVGIQWAEGLILQGFSCFFPGNLNYLDLHLRAGPNDMLILTQSNLMALRFLPLLECDGIRYYCLLFMNSLRKRSSCTTESNMLSSYTAVLLS